MILTGQALEQTIENIKAEEGYRSFPYKDTTGHLTIAYGHNLSVNGLSKAVCQAILIEDLVETEFELVRAFPAYRNLDAPRQGVLLDLAFNLGIAGLMGFKQFLASVMNQQWVSAAEQLLNSKAAVQAPNRYKLLADRIELGRL